MRSPRTSKPDSEPMKFMPSRLCGNVRGPRQHGDVTGLDRNRKLAHAHRGGTRFTLAVATALYSQREASMPPARVLSVRQCGGAVSTMALTGWRRRGCGREMAARALVEAHRGSPVLLAQRQRAAGNEAGRDAAGHVLQLVAILVARDQREHDEDPAAELARRGAERPARAQHAGADHQREGAQPDQPAESVVVEAEGGAGRIVEHQEHGAEADQPEDDPEQTVPAAQDASPRSRAMRARRVSRRGLRSTVSSRAGNSAMIRRRASAVMPIQPEISSRVRPQPKQ